MLAPDVQLPDFTSWLRRRTTDDRHAAF